MTDETNTQPQGVPAPVATQEPVAPEAQPASPAPVDVESMVASKLTEWEEKRIKPLQREISERDEMIRQLKTASMSEDERAQLQIEEQERERQEFETQRWLFQKAQENPQVAGLLEKFIGLEDPDEQFALLVKAFTPATPAATPAEPDESGQVPDIDPNNPAPKSPLGQLPTGDAMTREMRQRILQGHDYMDI